MRSKMLLFVMALTFAIPAFAATTQPTTTQAVVVSPEVDAILTRQEKAGQRVKDLKTDLTDEIYQIIPDDRQVKTGILRYRAAAGGKDARFMVFFDTLRHEDMVLRQKQWICFNGRWLREITESTKTAIDREVVGPNEKVEPTKLGEMPIPVGMKKAEVLEGFTVTLAKPEKTDPPNTDHLILLPRPSGPYAKRYERLEFWIDRKMDLPVRIVSRDRHSVLTTYNFKDIKLNTGIPDRDLWVDIPAGYGYQKEPMEGRE